MSNIVIVGSHFFSYKVLKHSLTFNTSDSIFYSTSYLAEAYPAMDKTKCRLGNALSETRTGHATQ